MLPSGLRTARLGVNVIAGWLAIAGIRLVEPFLNDVVLTREELDGLEQELLLSHAPGLGRESVREWLASHGESLGAQYANDMSRHFGADAAKAVTSWKAHG